MRPLLALAGIAAALSAALGAYLRTPTARKRTAEAQAALEGAVAAVDRELAADLELMSMFDQTRQAFVLENGQFLATAEVIAQEAPEAFAFVDDLFGRVPAVESAMERRGPAGSIADADLALIHAWEGDAREAQRILRASLIPPRRTRWSGLAARLRARFASR